MFKPKPGQKVRLVTPDNDRLDGADGFVTRLHEWGAEVLTEAAATGRYRAGWGEMAPAAHEANGHGPAGGRAGGKEEPGAARAKGFTGDVCPTCGSAQMVRDGKCLKCLACGDTSGGCS